MDSSTLFVHRLLLEYFAALPQEQLTTDSSATVQGPVAHMQ
jgi:hypothetical protein